MTTETVLTDEQIVACGSSSEINGPYSFARAIEQAVLQSPEVQGLRKDAEALRLMVSHRLTVKIDELDSDVEVFHLGECLAWPAIHHCKDDSERTAVARDAIRDAIAAMEQSP